jgi:hypothetical protein
MKTFICDECGGEFEEGWSEEEKLAELNQNFPNFEPEDCESVCDVCYNKIRHNK